MMKNVWSESDKEFSAIEAYRLKSNEFFVEHLKMRKVTLYLVAPKYQSEMKFHPWCFSRFTSSIIHTLQ
jgi:hypothetical protein